MPAALPLRPPPPPPPVFAVPPWPVKLSDTPVIAPAPPPLPRRRRISESALLAAIAERERAAIASGALRPIWTEETTVEDAGVRFIVRSVSSLAQKDAESRRVEPAGAEKRNPFLPPDAELTIGEITPTHVGVAGRGMV